MDDTEENPDEFWESAKAILPGTLLDFIDIDNGVFSSTLLASFKENEEGNIDIFVVYDPDGDYSIEPEYDLLETLNKKDFKAWRKKHRIEKLKDE